MEIEPGTYNVNVTRVNDDWYEVDGQGVFIKTSMCLNLALGADAILKIYRGGTGRRMFESAGTPSTSSHRSPRHCLGSENQC